MSIKLSKLLAAKQAEGELSNDALAKTIGVSVVSVSGVLKGKSKPNATTAKKYASYLGIDVAELTSAKKPAKAGKKTKTVKATAPKGAKRGPKKSGKLGLGAELVSIIASAAGVLDDALALAVHQAGKTERELIARLLSIR